MTWLSVVVEHALSNRGGDNAVTAPSLLRLIPLSVLK
jgi:hypothetical protein